MINIIKGVFYCFSCIADINVIVSLVYDTPLEKNVVILTVICNVVMISLFSSLLLKQWKIRKKGNIHIGDIDLTVIGQKNITRKKIRTMQADTVEYLFEFSQNGFDAYINFKGKVVKPIGSVKGISLNFSGDSNQIFENIDAYGYDLMRDPQKQSKIKGLLLERGGLNKEVFFKFHPPLKKNKRFEYMFHYRWNNCVNPDKDYIAAIPPFKNIYPKVLSLSVVLRIKELVVLKHIVSIIM